ncbi:MAG: hypothetical protein K6L81_16185, partial [Agarilytica sp.]
QEPRIMCRSSSGFNTKNPVLDENGFFLCLRFMGARSDTVYASFFEDLPGIALLFLGFGYLLSIVLEL